MRLSSLLLLFFLILNPFYAYAETNTLQRIEDYLNNLTTVVSDFTQAAPDGSLSSGKFYLERPDKMRWEYDSPAPILMVANGGTMVYFDRELAQTSYIPVGDTPAGILLRDKIHFDDNLEVKRLTEETGIIRLTLTQSSQPENGELTLEFSDKPLALRNLVITDATKQETRVSFSSASSGQPIDSNKFTIKK
ncbi:MAG: outer membrane lipoprotein carrier protein LolA [Rickettsiales bacterium]|nr:outer membrane lipoprotein carrier protein LolA [Rickettsiales bacterium]